MPGHQAVRVGLEIGPRWVFASALDWPGWCRRGRGQQAALDTLLDYTDRYAAVAGLGFAPGEPRVVGQVPGNKITDFGAPTPRARGTSSRSRRTRPAA